MPDTPPSFSPSGTVRNTRPSVPEEEINKILNLLGSVLPPKSSSQPASIRQSPTARITTTPTSTSTGDGAAISTPSGCGITTHTYGTSSRNDFYHTDSPDILTSIFPTSRSAHSSGVTELDITH